MNADMIRRLHAALPKIRQWIDEFVSDHAPQARAVSTLGFERLSACYPRSLLDHAKVVTLPRVPFPPVSRFGLPEFAPYEQRPFDGITFLDTFFLQQGRASESLYFHEMVHIVQSARLGADNFLLSYGVGLAQFGYEESPLEQMAYSLQARFDNGTLPAYLPSIIEKETDAIWRQVVPALQAVHGAP
jgi:hypothetical protein